MDVHQFAFLTRQPSAALNPRKRFLGVSKRALAVLMINVVFWQPIWVQAQGIAVSGGTNTSVGQAGNGVPVINIAAPNAAGLSHNQFKDYNVGKEGVILNNATNRVQNTQLGGYITGNSQLGGKAAGTILNEVNGGSSSQLNGYTEVAGQAARVIVANPYGVTCNGCGFINTPRVTLSTGKPVLDGNGKLDRFEVDGGSITIEGEGLNANNVDQFDLITRSAKINANIYAKRLNVVAGANDVNADTLATTPRAGNDAEKPALAIDSSALGGMYANTIKLVGTEQGVGVKLAGDMAASAGDMQIDANGHLSMAKAAASGAVNVTAASLDAQDSVYAGTSVNVQTRGNLKNQKVLAARDSITLTSGGELNNSGTIQAGINPDNTRNANGDVRLSGNTINNSASVVASRNLSATATQSLTNSGAIQAVTAADDSDAATGNVSLDSAAISNTGNVIASRSLTAIASQNLDNSGTLQAGINADNTRNATADVSLKGNTLSNTGNVLASRNLSATATQALTNNGGIFAAGQALSAMAATLDNQNNGQLLSDGDMLLSADNLLNTLGGYISSGGALTATARAISNRLGVIESGTTLDLSADSLDNTQGQISSLGQSGRSRVAIAGQLDNSNGTLESANADLSLAAASFQNLGGSVLHVGSGALDLAGLSLDNVGGSLVTQGALAFNKSAWTNSSVIQASSLTLDVDNFQQTASGQLLGTNRFVGRGTNWSTNGVIASNGDVDLTLSDQLTNSGRITSATRLGINAPRVSNLGTLAAGQALAVSTGSLLNDHALIFSGGDISLRVDELDNRTSDLYALGNLVVDRDGLGGLARRISNSSSNMQADGTVSLAASTLENIRTLLTVESGIYSASITPTACIGGVTGGDCEGGKQNRPFLISQRDHLTVTAASAASSITSGGSMLLTGGSLLNSASSIAAGGDLTAIFDQVTNTAIETHDTQLDRVFPTDRTRHPGGWNRAAANFTRKYSLLSPTYDKNALGGLEADLASFIGSTQGEKTELARTTQLVAPDQSYSAIIQAGGAVNVQASNGIDNNVVRSGYTYVGSGAKTDTNAPGYSTVVTLNPQTPPDQTQQQVNPINLPGFQLPTSQFAANPQKYLVESAPEFTNLGRFMNSDYLLSRLGYNPDEAQKRLGDGYYEQTLIRQAVIARTGQRFIDGQTSDAGLFKYLMDNAVASKDALNLAVGVSLTGEQVAALTHDIVWMEQHEVSGQNVLVPVLYMAQANNRLAPNGALITGRDVSLISGRDLNNSGTLRATNNLGASAGGNLMNAGLIEAGNQLQLRANNNLSNTAGGVIAGRDVNLVAVNGDLLNERSVTTHQSDSGYRAERTQFVNNAARIEAADSLALQAGRDLSNVGSVIKSGGDTAIQAGRDVNITAAQQDNSGSVGSRSRRQNITQYGSVVEAGRDFQVVAARNISAVASQISAQRNLTLDAAENLNISSAADEQHSYSKSKKITSQEDHVSQVGSVVKAGGDVRLTAGQDLALVSSQITAGNQAYVYAGNTLSLAAAQDSDYSLYDMKKKGSWGSKKTQRDEVTKVNYVGTEINTGGNLTLASGGDQLYQVAKLNSGKDLTLDSGGAIAFEGVKDLHQESHEKSKSDLAWNSMKGKGNTDETLRQTQLIAQGALAIKAVEGLKIDIKEVNQKSVSQTIDAMVKADPQLVWLKEAEKRGDVDWKLIKETHDSFKYSHSSLGQGAMLAIIIVVTIVTAGSGTAVTAGAAAGSATSSAVTAAGFSAATAAAAGSAANAAVIGTLSTLASQTAVSAINNKGNLGAVFKETVSSDSLKNLAVSGVTAGFTAGVIDTQFGGTTKPFNNITKGFDLSTLDGMGGFAIHAGAQGLASGTIKTAINGGSLGDNLVDGLVEQAGVTAAAIGYNYVGSYAHQQYLIAEGSGDAVSKAFWAEGGGGRTALHALMGGAISSATGGDFATGAIAAGASQAMAGVLSEAFEKNPEYRQAASQIVGLTAAGLAGKDVEKASWVSLMADQYNRQLHPDEIPLLKTQAESLAREANITPADAEKRLAQGLLYYTDKDWNGVITARSGAPDALTSKHLGLALAPLANSYAPASSSDVPKVGAERVYTADETAGLITQFRDTHAAEYADGNINAVNVQGPYVGDFGYEYDNFYRKNVAVPFDLGKSLAGTSSGAAKGAGTALSDAVGSAWALLNSPVQSSEQIANGLMSLTKNPADSLMNSVETSQTKQAMATIYEMQGNYSASAAIRAQSDVEFALNFLPVNRAKTLADLGALGRSAGELGAVGKAADELNSPGLLTEKGPCCFAAGTKVSTPQGDRTIESLKVGDVVWSKPEKGGKPFAAAILATHQRSDQPIYRLKLKNVRGDGSAEGETLLVTPSHPFYVPAKRDFIPAIDLKPGDLLQSLADGDSENTSSQVDSLELHLPEGKTYNLTVDVGHTFYVGKLKTWVHNTGPCNLPPDYFSGGAKGVGATLETTNPVVVSGGRAIDKAQSYEGGVRGMYGGTSAFEERQFRTVVGGKIVNGVADDVAVIGGKKTAIEAKFVDDWGSSLRNPASPSGSKPWSVAEQTKMVDQAKKYSSGFDGGAIYHTNSPELASYYSKVFTDAGVTKFKFVITPATK